MGRMRIAVVAALAMAGAAVAQGPATSAPAPLPAPAAAAAAGVLATVQPGLWHVRMVDGSKEPERDICVHDSWLLVQLRHGAAACERFVAADEPKLATVSYTCPGAGSGRTSLRRVGPALRIDSQGIANKAPFAFVAEARRTGDCPAAPVPTAAPGPAAAPAR